MNELQPDLVDIINGLPPVWTFITYLILGVVWTCTIVKVTENQ
jgi:hypothetical protein